MTTLTAWNATNSSNTPGTRYFSTGSLSPLSTATNANRSPLQAHYLRRLKDHVAGQQANRAVIRARNLGKPAEEEPDVGAEEGHDVGAAEALNGALGDNEEAYGDEDEHDEDA